MKTYIYITVLLILLSGSINAQLTLEPMVPAIGLMQKSQLWNVLIINNSATVYNCRLNLIVQNRFSGQTVFTASSGQFTVSQGAKQQNLNTLNPIEYNYMDYAYNNGLQDLLPIGSYTACYNITTIGNKTDAADNCVQFEVEPLSPPMLTLPSDSLKTDSGPGQFSWIPPTPAGMFKKLQYEIIICLVKDGQDAASAIQQNLPFYSEGNLLSNILNYPASAPNFDKEKWYAWQVIARDGESYAGKSETRVFKIKPPSLLKAIIEQAPYLKMKKNNSEKGMAPNGILKLSYLNEANDSIAEIKIIQSGRAAEILGSFNVSLKQGENLIQIDLKKLHLPENVTYKAQIRNSRNENWNIEFETRRYKAKPLSEKTDEKP